MNFLSIRSCVLLQQILTCGLHTAVGCICLENAKNRNIWLKLWSRIFARIVSDRSNRHFKLKLRGPMRLEMNIGDLFKRGQSRQYSSNRMPLALAQQFLRTCAKFLADLCDQQLVGSNIKFNSIWHAYATDRTEGHRQYWTHAQFDTREHCGALFFAVCGAVGDAGIPEGTKLRNVLSVATKLPLINCFSF